MIFKTRLLLIMIPTVIILGLWLSYIVFMKQYKSDTYFIDGEYDMYDYTFLDKHLAKLNENWRNLSEEEINSLSKLGRILYLNETPIKMDERKEKYKILMWQYKSLLASQLVYDFRQYNPFENCSVSNCILSFDDNDLNTADIVLIHMRSNMGVGKLPSRENSIENQIWVFSTEEGPFYTLMHSKSKLRQYNGIFNWTMTYRMDADIPIPYGRTILDRFPKKFDLQKEFNEWIQTKRRDVLVAIMGSNCVPANNRWDYVKELKKYIDVDDYGRCGTLICPGHISSDCAKIDKYMFYLSFENSNCDDYLTEKVWWHGYHKNSIPIIMGPQESNLKKLLPYNSYVNVGDFASARELGKYLLHLNSTPRELVTYLAWKSRYTILNEHGYFNSNSYYYCRVCEGLNYNSKENKVYNDMDTYWGKGTCYPAWDE